MKVYKSRFFSLVLFTLLMVVFGSNQVFAQTEDDEEISEESDGFFDDMNESRFNSSYESSGNKNSIEYKRNASRDYENQNNSENNYQARDLDIEVHHETSNGSIQVIGGSVGSYDNNNSGNNVPNVSNGMPATVPVERKTKNPLDTAFPDNPGDPDVPVDGGIGFLIAAGMGLGIWKRKNKSV